MCVQRTATFSTPPYAGSSAESDWLFERQRPSMNKCLETLDVEQEPTSSTCNELISEVERGLVHRPRSLPPWIFYNQLGSALFERITTLPEYYLTSANASYCPIMRVPSSLNQAQETGILYGLLNWVLEQPLKPGPSPRLFGLHVARIHRSS